MEVAHLLGSLRADISVAQDQLIERQRAVVEAERHLTDLQVQLSAVEGAYRRYGGEPPPTLTEDESWRLITRTDAVERVLRELGPLHLSEIVDWLEAFGRERDRVESVSATLTQLKDVRRSVVNVGKGRWDYCGEAAPIVAP